MQTTTETRPPLTYVTAWWDLTAAGLEPEHTGIAGLLRATVRKGLVRQPSPRYEAARIAARAAARAAGCVVPRACGTDAPPSTRAGAASRPW